MRDAIRRERGRDRPRTGKECGSSRLSIANASRISGPPGEEAGVNGRLMSDAPMAALWREQGITEEFQQLPQGENNNMAASYGNKGRAGKGDKGAGRTGNRSGLGFGNLLEGSFGIGSGGILILIRYYEEIPPSL